MEANETATVEHLRRKLQEAEDLIDAIRAGRIDALVISGQEKDEIYTLQGADHTYRILIETMDEGALILSPEGAVLYCNRRFAEMVEEGINGVLGHTIEQFIEPRHQSKFSNVQAHALIEESTKAEINFISVNGGIVPALVSLRTLRLDDMDALCLVAADLSEQKAAEETLKSYSHRLYRQNAELKRRAEQLARLSAELTMAEHRERKRMSRILHDGLQQMLASAKMQAGAVADDLQAGELRASISGIETILGDAIRVSRSLSVDLSPPILHEGGLANGLEWLQRTMCERYDFRVDLHLEDRPVLPEEIKVMVFEAVRELLFNAVKHAQVDCVCLSLGRTAQGQLQVMVSDQGQGFDLHRLSHEPDAAGGFGLFSIRERLGLMGGSLRIKSTPGKGSCFTLLVPMDEPPQAAAPEASAIPASTVEESVVQGAPTRVLVADDHTLFRDGISRLLNREPDIVVVGHAANGKEAIELAHELAPHVILMDIGMPQINGIEATTVIHREKPEIRIIGLSMYEDQERAEVMRQAGAADYKNKACAASELLAAVRGTILNRDRVDNIA